MKKYLSLVLAVVMVILAVPVTAEDVEKQEFREGYYKYTVENGEATITKVDNSIEGDVVTPTTLGGYPVTAIGDSAFFYCYDVKSVTVSEGVKVIGYGVFGNCHSLETVIVPESIEELGSYVFSACTATTIVLPDKEIKIGYNAFSQNSYYDDPSNWEGEFLYVGKHLVGIDRERNSQIKGNIVIKEGTLSISSDLFAYRTPLTGVEIPSSLKTIGKNMFLNCQNLSKVIIPDSVTFIDESAFNECPKLVIFCNEGSYAETYAIEQGLSYRIIGKDYPGDANIDGSVNLSDVTLLLQYIAKWDVVPDVSAADVTGDGEINLSDVTRLLQYIAKWDVTLG